MQKTANIVDTKVATYPRNIQEVFLQIRKLIFKVGDEHKLGSIQETLKWGEPAYLVKGGSTLRIDWKATSPQSIYLFFNCNTRLVETFREVYFDVFDFEGNRAIKLDVTKRLPSDEIKACILMTLQYHKLKHLPMLGA